MNIFKKISLCFKKPYYFPRKDFKVFTRYKLPEALKDIPLANSKLGYVNVKKIDEGHHNLNFETWHFFGGDRVRRGDVWVTTSASTGELMAVVFTKVDCYFSSMETCSCDYGGEGQNFGFAGDLLQIERMKELVIKGKKMKPVVLS